MNSPLDRRGMLRQSLAAGVALAAGSGVAAAEPATGEASASSTSRDVNSRVALAVMGTNGRGHALALEFASLPNVAIRYVCDVDREAAAKTATKLASEHGQQPQQIGDFRRALDDPAVDALVIAAPDHWHGPAMILACAAGKHVYVEKPACHNPREGEWMIAAARKSKRVVQVGSQRRSSIGVHEALARLEQGEIGRARFARGWITSTRPTIGRGHEAPPPERLDYALWQGPAPARPYRDNMIPYHWHWFWHWGTGELGNNGIHALDLCRWGLMVDAPRQVTCSGAKLFFDDDQETPDTQLATFDFGDKIITWEHRTWHRRGIDGLDFGAAFYGDSGTLVIGSREYQIFDREGKQLAQVPLNNGEMEHLANFLAAIREGVPTNAPVEEAVKSTLLCQLGNIAYRTGETVHFEPAQQASDATSTAVSLGKIVGNAAQQALWGREYAKGWEPRV